MNFRRFSARILYKSMLALVALVLCFVQNISFAEYNYGDTVSCTDVNPDNQVSVSLKAQWEPVQYYVYYNTGMNPTPFTVEETVTVETPIWPGHNFTGWCVDSSYGCSNPVMSYTVPVGTTNNVWLNANWENAILNVDYKCWLDGESFHSDTVTYSSSYTTYGDFGDCYSAGHHLGGWGCSYLDEITNNMESVRFDINSNVTSWNAPYDSTCVPVWTPNTYNVSFKANSKYVENSDAMPDEQHEYNESFVLPQNAYVNNNYDFGGWCTQWNATTNSCDGTVYTDGQTVSNLTDVDGATVELYAIWNPKSAYCQAGTYLPAGTLTCEPCTKGYYCPDSAYYDYNSASDQGRRSCFSVFYSGNATTDSTGATLASQCYEPCANYTRYELVPGHDKVYYGSNANEVCKYQATIVYRGNKHNCQNQAYVWTENGRVNLCNPSVEGRTFLGWKNTNTNTEYTVESYPDMENVLMSGLMPNEQARVIMEPMWDVDTYSITYRCRHPMGVQMFRTTVKDNLEYGDTSELLDFESSCVTLGINFIGWDCDTENIADGVVTITDSNVVCDALTEPKTYSIHFDGNGADEGSMSDIDDLPYFPSQALPANQFVKNGYNFAGWCTDSVAPNTACTGNSYADKKNVFGLIDEDGATVTLYAMWNTATYSINYVAPNDITLPSSNPVSYTINDSDILLANPEHSGYEFIGWCTDADLSDCSANMVIPSGSYGNKVFYAKIQPKSFNITYKYYDGTLKTIDGLSPDSYTYNISAYLPRNVVVEDKYLVTGWYHDIGTRYSTNNVIGAGSTGNVVVYAKLTMLSCAANQYILNGECVACPENSYSAGGTIVSCDCVSGYVWEGGECLLDDTPAPASDNRIVYKGVIVPSNTIININDESLVQTYIPNQSTYLNSSVNVSGYGFGGWYYDSNLTLPNRASAINVSGSGPVTIYAKLTSYSVSCEPGYYLPAVSSACAVCAAGSYCSGGNYLTGQTDAGIDPCPSVYSNSDIGSDSLEQCYADITYVYNYDTPNTSGRVYYDSESPNGYSIDLPSPTREGYSFEGWTDGYSESVDNETVFDGDTILYANWEKLPKFTVTTVDNTSSFSFNMSAAGNFTVDWGDGNVETITRNDTNEETYSHNYSSAGTYTIGFDGAATGYSTVDVAAISFAPDWDATYSQKIASISGSLGAIFGTVASPTTGQSQPRFYLTFYGASNMIGNIPENLFAGISGAPASYMFADTFSGCSSLTGSIPENLFAGISGAPADNMFSSTFYNCYGLTGNIPENLFADITGAPADYMFFATFLGCSSLTGSIPENLFTGISGTPADSMFSGTFAGCSSLTGSIPENLFADISGAPADHMFSHTFYNCSGLTGTIPENLFAGITGAPTEYMFSQTFSDCSGLTGNIPENLFSGISGAPADNMFSGTFYNCSGLTGSIPENLFADTTGAPASYMFYLTFSGCSGLTGSIPENLFAGITGAPANYMFYGTFNGCSGLTGFVDENNNITSYIPADFLSNITSTNYQSGQMSSMFAGTGLVEFCPENMYKSDTPFAVDWDPKVSCKPCPAERPYSAAGSTDISQCYAKVSCEAGYYLPGNADACEICTAGSYCGGGTFVLSDIDQGIGPCPTGYTSEAGAQVIGNCAKSCETDDNAISCSGHVFADDTDDCSCRYPIRYHMNKGMFAVVVNAPEYFDFGNSVVNIPTPMRPHYEFAGWYLDANYTDVLEDNVLSCDRRGAVDLYAKWNFVCESGVWMNIGNDKICLYTDKTTDYAMAVKYNGNIYYLNMIADSDRYINGSSDKKMRIKYGNTIFNAFDMSAE